MKFDASVPEQDRRRIARALQDIKTHGNLRQRAIAEFIEQTAISIHLGAAEKVGGSGSVFIDQIIGVNWAIARGDVSMVEAAKYVRLSIARETIDTGGQCGIEGTLVHEGKHALDFALMISTFSRADEKRYFDPTAFQREYSAHLTSAFYLMRRGGEYAAEGVGLGILFQMNGRASVNQKGIRARLENNYGLTVAAPGKRLSELSFPSLAPRGTRLWGLL
ncbi:MAG TPA: hypothetical protein VGC76_01325 [Pyrinomonadaceae bacterium]|jgi:hypothetical protein